MLVVDFKPGYPTVYNENNGVKRAVFDDVHYYASCVNPAHYPVPAIPLEVVYCIDYDGWFGPEGGCDAIDLVSHQFDGQGYRPIVAAWDAPFTDPVKLAAWANQ